MKPHPKSKKKCLPLSQLMRRIQQRFLLLLLLFFSFSVASVERGRGLLAASQQMLTQCDRATGCQRSRHGQLTVWANRLLQPWARSRLQKCCDVSVTSACECAWKLRHAAVNCSKPGLTQQRDGELEYFILNQPSTTVYTSIGHSHEILCD